MNTIEEVLEAAYNNAKIGTDNASAALNRIGTGFETSSVSTELNALKDTVNRINNTTEMNGIKSDIADLKNAINAAKVVGSPSQTTLAGKIQELVATDEDVNRRLTTAEQAISLAARVGTADPTTGLYSLADTLSQFVTRFESHENTMGNVTAALAGAVALYKDAEHPTITSSSTLPAIIEIIKNDIITLKSTDNTHTLNISDNTTAINQIIAKLGYGNLAEDETGTIRAILTTLESNLQKYARDQDTMNSESDRAYTDTKTAEISAAHRDENDTLDARFDAIESAATELTGRVAQNESDIDTIESNATTLTGRVDTLSSKVSTLETGVANAATQSSVNDLTGRVTALEGKDTIVMDEVTYDSNGKPQIDSANIKADADYLLHNTDGKYYYWRYINNEWMLISGGGGSGEGGGNNSGYDFTSVEDYNAATKTTNADYYVEKDDGVHHYRWVQHTDLDTGATTLEEIEIGCVADTSNIRKYNIALETVTANDVTTNYLNFYEFGANESNEIDEADEANEIARLLPNRIRQIVLPATGGGGGTVSGMKFTRITPRLFTSAINGDQPIKVQFFFTTGEANDGAYYDLYIGRIVNNATTDERKVLSDVSITSGDPEDKSTTWPTSASIPTGFYEIDLSQYFNQVGYYSIRLQARSSDNDTLTGSINWELHTINFDLTSDSEDGLIVSVTEPVELNYTPWGAINKTLHVVIDGNTDTAQNIALSERTSGRPATVTLPTQTHGLHKIDMYMDAVINNMTIPTKHIYREYIWYDASDENAAPIIVASRYNNQTIDLDAYTDFTIPYSVYHKEEGSYLIEFYRDYGMASEVNLGQIQATGNVVSTFSYIPVTADNNDETHIITIKVGNQTATITLHVSPIDQDVSPISGALIDFDPSTLTNNSVNREPEWKTATTAYDNFGQWTQGTSYSVGSNVIYNGYAYTCRVAHTATSWIPSNWSELGAYKFYLKTSPNFNWSNDISGGGYKEDEDGKCFIIKAGSYIDLNYKMFKSNNGRSAIYDTGAEMKVIFKTAAVRDAGAVWFTNVQNVNNKQVGIQLGAHVGWLKTDKASDGSIAATDNYSDWVAGTAYTVGQIVVYDRANDGTIYECITENSDTEFNDKKWLKMGKVETSVDATNTYLYFPYSEEDKIELDININKYIEGENNNFIMSYEDGVPSKALPYIYGDGGDGLYHPTGEEATIRIGSPDCDVYIYRLRVYNKSLTTGEILQNFIADGKTIQEKVQRYERNCIYWDEEQQRFFTTPSGTAKLDPIKLAEKMPNVKVLMLEAPTFTLNKNSYIKDTSLRCLQVQIDSNGNYVYPPEGNWFFQKGYHAGQGTTSDNYGQAGRNVDFLFECDGVNQPAKQKNIKGYTSDYKSSLLRGNNTSKWVVVGKNAADEDIYAWRPVDGAEAELCSDWKGDDCKVQLTSTSVPNNYFNLKVNIASSENVNNALFQRRYSEFVNAVNPSPATPNQEAAHNYASDSRFSGPVTVKNSMEFVPAVLFIRETSENMSEHSEFLDNDWHFYALGNIGDSKKTDYTRAYDPTDMNEFTLEISDNNTKNSQFQSGLYKVNDVDTVEQADSGTNSMNYLWGLTDEQWNATRSPNADELAIRAQINAGEEDLVDVIMGGEQEDGSDGQVYVNYRHRMLHAEPFDGDHSFEFRYACQGDYRDGDLINPLKTDTDPEKVVRYKLDKAQEKINRKVFEAFYSWLVTANDTQFRDEAELWFVPGAMEFFYAYTHYYTMMDNRAKNTFWHFAKTGTRHAVPIGRAVPDLMHIYEVSDGNNGYIPASGDFDNSTQYYTQYAFDLWAYDMDTAAGIDNNGALVFPYGKEDGDYRTEGDPLSGMAFNGAGSIFWRRLSKTFATEIRTIMTSAPVTCFNAQNLIDEFDATQECYPEEVWRLDIERKYIRTFTGITKNLKYDNAVATGKQNPRFLRSMMQGRKKYQRRQWIRDQGVYFNSKYRLTDIITNDNTIEFNATTPAIPEWQSNTQYYINDYVRTRVEPFDELKPKFQVWRCTTANTDSTFTQSHWQASVTPEYLLTLTPYQDMYLNVQVGNGNYQPQTRAKANRTYTYDISGSYQETRIYINGANHLSAIGGLAPMYPYEFDLRALQHLKVLDIGTDDATYTNTKFTTLGLETNKPLLETLNIKNCHSLGGMINLTNATNIRTVEAEGTVVTSVNLPQYSNIETLHLPYTTTDISLYAARQLNDFKVLDANGNIDYSNITKLNIVDSDYSENINWIDIALEMLANSTTISLLNLYSSSVEQLRVIDPLYTQKQALELADRGTVELSGTLNVEGAWGAAQLADYEAAWPELNIVVDDERETVQHKVIYRWEDGLNDGAELYHYFYENNDEELIDPVELGYIPTPVKPQNERESYTFGEFDGSGNYSRLTGWREINSSRNAAVDSSLSPVKRDIILVTNFIATPRSYPIEWYLHENDRTPVYTTRTANRLVPYGSGQELDLTPTARDIIAAGKDLIEIQNGSTTRYRYFNGWNTLPINISPSSNDTAFKIYAKWQEVNIDFNNLDANTELTPALLYALAHSSFSSNDLRQTILDIYDTINIQMGYEGTLEGTQLPYYRNDSLYNNWSSRATVTTNVTPFANSSEPFTLAIDYQFNKEDLLSLFSNASINLAVLLGCEDPPNSSSIQSLKLGCEIDSSRQNIYPYISFGGNNERRYIGNTSTLGYRNVVVLRKPRNSDTLYIYSGTDQNGLIPNFKTYINWPSITYTGASTINSTAPLVFGYKTTTYSSTNTEKRAPGTIHWAKYWNEDIGVAECKQLALWPHETMTFAVADYDGADLHILEQQPDTPISQVMLTSITSSSIGEIMNQQNPQDTTNLQAQQGWGEDASAWLRQFYNNRVFLSLPTMWQSFIGATNALMHSTGYRPTKWSGDSGVGQKFDINLGIATCNDEIYIPSFVEVIGSAYEQSDAYKDRFGAHGEGWVSFPWINYSNMHVYSPSNPDTELAKGLVELGYKRLRFPNIPLAEEFSVYQYNGETTPLESIMLRSQDVSDREATLAYLETLRGKVVLVDQQTGAAYIYATQADKNNGIQTVAASSNSLTCTYGGWVKSSSYWLRSVHDVNSLQPPFFMYVTATGVVPTQNPSYNWSTGSGNNGLSSCGITYSFSI